MSMSSRERLGPVGGVGGSLFTGEAVLGVFGEDRLRPLNRRPSFPPRPLDALLKESTCARQIMSCLAPRTVPVSPPVPEWHVIPCLSRLPGPLCWLEDATISLAWQASSFHHLPSEVQAR